MTPDPTSAEIEALIQTARLQANVLVYDVVEAGHWIANAQALFRRMADALSETPQRPER